MDGYSRAASTIAHPMKCVNESLTPRSASWRLNAARTAQSRPTSTSRNDVAVGMSSDASMFLSSRRAGPEMGVPEALVTLETSDALDAAALSAVSDAPSISSAPDAPDASVGSSPFTPLSNNLRHSSGTEDGSLK
jgi:hypothetical protein